jgi:hypothetical protein
MIKINLKRLFHGLVIGMCMIMHSAAANSDASDTLESVYKMQSSALSAIGNFYMFSGLQGDSNYSRKIDSDIKEFEDNVGLLTSTDSKIIDTKLLAKSLVIWQKYRELIEINQSDFLKDGYANARLVDNLGNISTELAGSLQTLYDKIIKDTGFQISKQTVKTRKMGLIIKSIVTEYIARSTSNAIILSYSFNEGGMKKQAAIFDRLLSDLKAESESDEQIYKLTDQIAVKWSFIAKSVANYNENTVPFIVSTNGNRITKNLKIIGDHYRQKIKANK